MQTAADGYITYKTLIGYSLLLETTGRFLLALLVDFLEGLKGFGIRIVQAVIDNQHWRGQV